MPKIRIISNLSMAAGLVFLSGCVVTDYKKPVSELGEALNVSVSTVIDIDRGLTQVKNDQLVKLIGSNKAVLDTSSNSCSSGTKKCSLVVQKLGSGKLTHFPVKSTMPSAVIGLEALKSYMDNLEAIAGSDTVPSITRSINEALVSVASIEAAVAKANGTEDSSPKYIKGYSEPFLVPFKWFVNEYVHRMKVKALASATERAQPAVESLAKWHQVNGQIAATVKDAKASKLFKSVQGSYDNAQQKTPGLINSFVEAASTYDASLKGRAAVPLSSFLKAHTKLNNHLNGRDNVSLADAILEIKKFKNEADEFKKIIEDFRSAHNTIKEVDP